MNITELLTDLASNTNAIIRAAASNLNLTSSQAFHLLSIPFDGIPISKLAHRLGLDNSTLTRNIQKLEKLALVNRTTCPYDKRVQLIVLTPKGSDLINSLEAHLLDQNNHIMEHIDLDTQLNLSTVLEKLCWALDCIRGKP